MAFADQDRCREFRWELSQQPEPPRNYAKMLAHIAGVEDLTKLDQAGGKSFATESQFSESTRWQKTTRQRWIYRRSSKS
jgi:hypothetical protein